MRKSIMLIIALTIYSVLVGAAWAGRVAIGGTHPEGEIKAACDGVGGTFSSSGGHYGCINTCGDSVCSVACVNGKCTGSCPKCGRVDPSPLPVLGGGRTVVTRALKNTVSPAKRY